MNKQKKEQLRRKIKVFTTILKLALLLFILVGLPLYIYFYQPEVIERMSSLESVNAFFKQYKTQSILVYIGAQVAQIVVCIIPGQWLQFAAGYMYGFWLGFLFSLIGAAIGSVITYYLAKLLGRDAMHLIFGEQKINQFIHKLNSKKAVVIVFLIFLIPGVPKDLCNYAAGISEMKLKPFLIVSLIGRSPGMMGSLLIGRQIEAGDYTGAIVIAVIAVILFIIGIVMRKKLTIWLDKAYDKLYK
ncbi:VTT domain-containing protein [Ihubacter massiliensis]|uniref:TVP38/TMEM64 family membrane protein n=1 Tax=Hominibacterium faecale TaxID=2839743 RepID=A0A9J6QL86_9FIRM|nr:MULTISPECIES: VTT domain-containing protein [Eubacteriales Family XIII. Incertae Sedis]MCC2865279.1 VTT domain-containing protein [Anaerovorax odorimutans]MCI7303885.1 VTT domain-containing protein [Clostridia bacterium]MDE8732823.1 VTT domain-containing protein [Eubacteriales bacterium DFI.9.88]MDY3011638.1 VTT domain-containing protein [Clostridiales Family XIII bacterium]MCO7120997.1 VTT domain-containing protein [Ihubacter massiliensis]